MITKKEDLINTYIENDFGELRDLYIKKAIELGFKLDWSKLPGGTPKNKIIATCKWNGGDRAFTGQTSRLPISTVCCSCLRELTLSDLKPRTRTEYVKVTESIFDLRDEFERGELFTKKAWGEYVLIKKDTHLAYLYELQSHENSTVGIYRRVEVEIDERQEFIERAKGLLDASKDADYSLGNMYDAGCRFVGANGEIE